MVFQQFNLFPHMSVLDNVTLAPTLVRHESHAVARDRAMALLERVRITDQAHKKIRGIPFLFEYRSENRGVSPDQPA